MTPHRPDLPFDKPYAILSNSATSNPILSGPVCSRKQYTVPYYSTPFFVQTYCVKSNSAPPCPTRLFAVLSFSLLMRSNHLLPSCTSLCFVLPCAASYPVHPPFLLSRPVLVNVAPASPHLTNYCAVLLYYTYKSCPYTPHLTSLYLCSCCCSCCCSCLLLSSAVLPGFLLCLAGVVTTPTFGCIFASPFDDHDTLACLCTIRLI
jgi:hypothetical protein